MPSQFFGLNIAASALNAFQASVNTAANNVSNVQTKGYSKQVTNKEAGEGMRVNAKYGTTGTGVNAVSVTQLRDSYYDTKYWNNNGNFHHLLESLLRPFFYKFRNIQNAIPSPICSRYINILYFFSLIS